MLAAKLSAPLGQGDPFQSARVYRVYYALRISPCVMLDDRQLPHSKSRHDEDEEFAMVSIGPVRNVILLGASDCFSAFRTLCEANGVRCIVITSPDQQQAMPQMAADIVTEDISSSECADKLNSLLLDGEMIALSFGARWILKSNSPRHLVPRTGPERTRHATAERPRRRRVQLADHARRPDRQSRPAPDRRRHRHRPDRAQRGLHRSAAYPDPGRA